MTTTTIPARVSKGVPTGGQFAASARGESGVALVEPLVDDFADDYVLPKAVPLGGPPAIGEDPETADRFPCTGKVDDGRDCLNVVSVDGGLCKACDGTATDKYGNLLGRGGFARDGRGSAIVTSPTGEVYKSGKKKGQIKMVPYKSASGVVIGVSTAGLDTWKQQQLMRALARDRDLAARFHAAMDEIDPTDLEAEKTVINKFRDEAHEIAETQLAAAKGTFAHWLTECADNGESPVEGLAKGEALGIDPAMAQRIADGWTKVNDDHGFASVGVEAKIVNDDLRAAGTTDRVVALSKPLTFDYNGESVTLPAGTRLISDLKTGKLRTDRNGTPNYWQKYSGQLAAYAGGQPYDPINGERLGWDTYGGQPSQDWAVLVHGDLEAMAKGEPGDDGGFKVFMVDIREGRRLAAVSNDLREAEKDAGKGFTAAL